MSLTPLFEFDPFQQSCIYNWPTMGIADKNVKDSGMATFEKLNFLIDMIYDDRPSVMMQRENAGSEEDWNSFILKDTIAEMEKDLDKGLNFASEELQLPMHLISMGEDKFEANINSKFFVIKSYNESDIIAGFHNNCWSSTRIGNQRLDRAYRNNNGENVYLFFSVNGSGRFCGVAQMIGPVDFERDANCWSDPKWKGSFPVRFLFVKDIPNKFFRNMMIQMVRSGEQCLSSVIMSRDTQEVPLHIGQEMMGIFMNQNSVSSFLSPLS